MYCKSGGLFDKVGGLYKSVTTAVSGIMKSTGITSIQTSGFGLTFNPATIPATTTSATAGLPSVGVTMQPQVPTKMFLIGGGVLLGIIILMMFMRK